MMLEPGTHREEREVQRGGGGQEGGARDEHPGAGGQQAQAQPPNIGTKLAQHTAVEIHLTSHYT